jgi:chloride channel protein, CIC family
MREIAKPPLPVAAISPMRRRVAEIAPAAGREETESAAAGARRAEARLRDSELFLLVLALGAGVAAGLGVVMIDLFLDAVRHFAFAIPFGGHLSDAAALGGARLVAVPIIGGLFAGLSSAALRRWRPREVVDAIEANALFGGRMSLGDSLGLVWVTILSGGFGASVGLEAAYTQLGAALASRLGRSVGLRRDDVRTLVGCGAAGAIAAAFNAPLTGAFYAFELIIGSYTLQALAPVGIAALTGTLVVRGLVGSNPIFVVWHDIALSGSDYLAFFGVGLASAGLGIVTMKGVTSTETLFRVQAVPRWARPALGGLLIGLIALPFPEILGSGHGGILHALHSGYALPFLAGLVVAKIVASAVSIGSGFRGGLFSSSLFLGSLFGSLIGECLTRLGPGLSADPLIYALVGMGAVAAAIVGAPMTMIMLVLETTGDFSATIGVMVGVVTAAIAVRHWFGYSFATWRFHLRGLSIRSPEDIGWINELLIGPMMRRDPAVIAADLSLDELHRRFPAGSTRQVFVVDGDGRLSGSIDPTEANGSEGAGETQTVGDLVSEPATFLLPGDNLRAALDRFSEAAQEILPVIDNPDARRVLGYLSEAYALRRYAHELERHRGARQDDAGIFSPAAADSTPNPKASE